MNAKIIKVKFARPAKENKKQATIHTEDGAVFGVWPDKFGLLRPGQTYRVEFSERDYKGKTYRTITKCEPAAVVEERSSDQGTIPQRSSPNDAEFEFVTRILGAAIQSQVVDCQTENDLIKAARLLRQVYAKVFVA